MKIETTIENIMNIIDFLKPDTKIILEIDEEKEESFRWSVKSYGKIKEALEKEKINMKDIRDIIMLSYSYFCLGDDNNDPGVKEVLDYFKENKERIKENVYSEDFIMDTLKALSETTNPLLDFLDRLEKTEVKGNFETYYKNLYGTSK